MKYEIKEVKEEIDILYLTQDEFDRFNDIYKDGIRKRYPSFARSDVAGSGITDMNKMILTDGYHRMEFHVQPEK